MQLALIYDNPSLKEVGQSKLIADCALVVVHYQTYHPRAKAGENDRAKIRARFAEGYSVKDLCDAIDGCHRCPHNCGQNERGQKYQGLELIMRNSSQVQRFMEVPSENATAGRVRSIAKPQPRYAKVDPDATAGSANPF
jgi:hypothetical protein